MRVSFTATVSIGASFIFWQHLIQPRFKWISASKSNGRFEHSSLCLRKVVSVVVASGSPIPPTWRQRLDVGTQKGFTLNNVRYWVFVTRNSVMIITVFCATLPFVMWLNSAGGGGILRVCKRAPCATRKTRKKFSTPQNSQPANHNSSSFCVQIWEIWQCWRPETLENRRRKLQLRQFLQWRKQRHFADFPLVFSPAHDQFNLTEVKTPERIFSAIKILISSL